MKRFATVFVTAALGVFVPAQGFAQHAGAHVMMSPAELTWADLPSLPGVKIAVIDGRLS